MRDQGEGRKTMRLRGLYLKMKSKVNQTLIRIE
jgi:hypothetical protein